MTVKNDAATKFIRADLGSKANDPEMMGMIEKIIKAQDADSPEEFKAKLEKLGPIGQRTILVGCEALLKEDHWETDYRRQLEQLKTALTGE